MRELLTAASSKVARQQEHPACLAYNMQMPLGQLQRLVFILKGFEKSQV